MSQTGGATGPASGESTVERAEKATAVATLHEVFRKASVVVVAQYSGLTVAQMQTPAQAGPRTGRQRAGRQEPPCQDRSRWHRASPPSRPLLKGPTLIAYSDDPVAAPKVAVGFRQGPREIRDSRRRHGRDGPQSRGVKSLATMPSLDELRAKLVGLIQAPATKLAQLSTAPAAKLARVFGPTPNKDAA